MLGFVGILDLLSKALKYEFHYDYIEKKIWQYFFYILIATIATRKGI